MPMTIEFEKIYTQLFESTTEFYPSAFWFPENQKILNLLKEIKSKLRDGINDERKLRPDAKYFLLVNAYHLIILPLMIADLNKLSISYIEQQQGNILKDLDTILKLVKETIPEDEELSGHQVMRVIDKSWNDLEVTKISLWGQYDKFD
jgi:hypothetical protein